MLRSLTRDSAKPVKSSAEMCRYQSIHNCLCELLPLPFFFFFFYPFLGFRQNCTSGVRICAESSNPSISGLVSFYDNEAHKSRLQDTHPFLKAKEKTKALVRSEAQKVPPLTLSHRIFSHGSLRAGLRVHALRLIPRRFAVPFPTPFPSPQAAQILTTAIGCSEGGWLGLLQHSVILLTRFWIRLSREAEAKRGGEKRKRRHSGVSPLGKIPERVCFPFCNVFWSFACMLWGKLPFAGRLLPPIDQR